MGKILKKYTTIPTHLYVNRDADKQLRNIIDEMERPGYVLVARQMGKTNLLLNAKRELQDNEHLFAYIDFSTIFESQRDCYRNIINMIIEPNIEIFGDTANAVYEKRKNTKLPPNIEYVQELRLLLKTFKGKIIIILDEIDALTSAEYSDQIFAQIRSNYFASRTNFPEFNNLTYVLSGVIEPTELIKDKDKSPFNIGEKIYLDDFTYKEHLEFIKKSKLKINEDIINYIYSWTNGNPRLNFDICSSVEDITLKNKEVTKKDIDNIINKLYLTKFDVAPIDHIRELVKNDKDIRVSVVKILEGNHSINDDFKDKLYLAGIINSEFREENIKIKNKIISKSLSLDWINSVEEQIEDLFEVGYKLILREKNYKIGIEKLLRFLENNDKKTISQIELSHYYIGFALHKLNEYVKSNEHLTIQPISIETSPDLHYRQLMFVGQNFIALSRPEESFKYFKEIVDNYKKGEPYLYSALNYGINLMLSDFDKHHKKSLKLFNELLGRVDDITDEGLDEQKKDELKTLAYYHTADIYIKLDRIKDALKNLKYAQKHATTETMPFFKNVEFLLNNRKDESIIIEAYNIIIDNSIKLNVSTDFNFDFNEHQLYQILQNLLTIDNIDYFNNLIDYSLEYLFENKITKYQILYKIGVFSSDLNIANKAFDMIVSTNDTISKILLTNTYRQLSIINYNDNNLFQKYFSLYHQNLDNKKIEIDDLTAFAYAIRHYNGVNNPIKALHIGKEIENLLLNIDNKLRFDSLIIYFWLTNTYKVINDKSNSLKYANKTLDLIREVKSKGQQLSLLNEEGLTLIQNQMKKVIDNFMPTKPIRRSNKIGRNERVTVKYFTNDDEKTGKYKKFIDDIKSGKCKITSIKTTR